MGGGDGQAGRSITKMTPDRALADRGARGRPSLVLPHRPFKEVPMHAPSHDPPTHPRRTPRAQPYGLPVHFAQRSVPDKRRGCGA